MMSTDTQDVKNLYHYTAGYHNIILEVYKVLRVTEDGNYQLKNGAQVNRKYRMVDPKMDDEFYGDVWLTHRDDDFAKNRMRRVHDIELARLSANMSDIRNRLLLCDRPVVVER